MFTPKFLPTLAGQNSPTNLSRRRFVTGLAAGGALFGAGISPSLSATTIQKMQDIPTLRGNNFNLTYSPLQVNFTGQQRTTTAINGTVPAPVLRWKQGETVTLNVTNHLAVDTSIHWHGIILPSEQDGVPGISNGFSGIRPGETFKYQFAVDQVGTYWYHSHSGWQEQEGAYGAIIIDSIEPEPFSYDRDYVVLLSDWSDEKPENIYAKLKKLSHYYNFRERTLSDAWQEVQDQGWDGFWANRGMWNDMRMSDRDIADVTGYTYTYLMNGQTPADGWTGLFKRGEKVRLRFINAAAMTFFDVRIPGLKMTVVTADGQHIQPVSVDEFRIGTAETYDVIVEPSNDRAYSIFAQSIDRSGYTRGTLTPNPTMTAEVPSMDIAPILGHGDMGMSMEGMAMSMDHGSGKMAEMRCGAAMKHDSMHDSNKSKMGSGKLGFGSSQKIIHADTEYGPHIDMRADEVSYLLDDPGIGLRDSNRRILLYSDLRNLYKTPDPREPSREINLHLTGNMSRYMWSMNGIKFADAEPLMLKYGERVRINLFNDTMMNHPIHLHGLWSDFETGDADYIPRKHTIIVQPGSRVSYLVTADAMGGWAYHCHLLYHMPGMFRKVVVA